jgi:hypothetical protein
MTVTPAVPQRRLGALELLFGPAEDAAVPLSIVPAAANGNLGRALENLPPETRDIAATEVRSAAAALLNLDLVDLLIEGWRHYGDLTSAARRTVSEPGSSELVRLATHEVRVTQEPAVNILVDGRLIATVRFSISVVFDVSALLAGISAGRLVAVHSGRCDITGTLAIDGVDVASGQASLELPGVLPLTPGVRLLPAEEYPAAENEPSAQKSPLAARPSGAALTTPGGSATLT